MRLLILALMASQCFGAWSGYFLQTPATSQVSGGPHTDFPVLIDLTDNQLKQPGGGGVVTDAQGDDVAPYSDNTCTTLLPFELIAYDGTAGRWRAHVNVSSLSGSSNVYVCAGNSAITTSQANVAGTWNSGFVCVWHFGDGSTLSLADSTANGCTFTNSGATAVAGQIYGAASLALSFMYRNTAVVSSMPITMSAWLKSSTTTGVQPAFTIQSAGSNLNMYRLILYQSKVQAQTQATGPVSGLAATSSNYSTSNWFHAAAVFTSSTSRTAYLNGGSAGSNTTSVTPSGLDKSQTRTESTDEYFAGYLDELRVSNVARSGDWLITEYNSGTPSTFWAATSWTSLSSSARPRRIFVQ